jgi:hypothetical protein
MEGSIADSDVMLCPLQWASLPVLAVGVVFVIMNGIPPALSLVVLLCAAVGLAACAGGRRRVRDHERQHTGGRRRRH